MTKRSVLYICIICVIGCCILVAKKLCAQPSFIELVPDANGVYLINQNLDLEGGVLSIPQGKVLRIDGAVISNGSIEGNGSCVEAPNIKIFETDVYLKGNWTNHQLPVEWYGAVGDNSTDCTAAINAAINNTSIHAVSLVPGAKYIISSSLKMRSSEFAFGCFEVGYSHEDSPAAYIYSNCPDHILEFPKGETIKGINLKGIVLHKTNCFNYQGDGVHIEGGAFYRSEFDGVRVYYCNNGFFEHFDNNYRGFSLNKFQNCVFSGCRYGFHLTHDTECGTSYWVNLNSWDNCQFGFNLECGLWIDNVYSCEQNLFASCGFEGVSMDENTKWNNDTDIAGIKLNGQGYGLTTFLNCYFERNHPNHYVLRPTARMNETSKCCVADAIIEGMFVAFDKCTFNDGIVPIVVRDGKVGISINNTIFRTGYDCDYMVLFKGLKSDNLVAGNYFTFDVPVVAKKYDGHILKAVDCNISSLPMKVNYLTIN